MGGALGVDIEDRPFAKSTLQMVWAQLTLHDNVTEVFEQSPRLSREAGYLQRVVGCGLRWTGSVYFCVIGHCSRFSGSV